MYVNDGANAAILQTNRLEIDTAAPQPPIYGAGGGGGSMAIGGAITSATAGSVLFAGTSGVLQQNNANFFWDNTNSRLGIGINVPLAPLHVVGSVIALRATLANGSGGVISNDSTTTYFQALTSNNDSREFNIAGQNVIFRSGTSSYTEGFRLASNGNLILNSSTLDGGQRLQVYGDAFIKGSVATAGTNALTINNSANTSLFYIRNDGFASFEAGLSVYNSISFLADTIIGSRQNNYLSINLPRIRIGGAAAGFTTGTIVSLEGNHTTASGVGRGTYLLQNITASANNDVLVGLDVAPTFTNGSFTGVSNIPLRVGGTSVTQGGFGASAARIITLISNLASGTYTQLAIQGPTNGGAAIEMYDGSGVAVADFGMNTLAKEFGFVNRMTCGFINFYTHDGTSLASRLHISTLGNILIQNGGTFLDTGQRLQVQGTTLLNGNVSVTEGSQLQWAGAREYLVGAGGRATMVLNQGSNALGYGLTLTVVGLNQASGNGGGLSITPTINPTSGTAVFNLLNLSPTVNQTGGANGITRGLYVNPTLTAAADFRAIEVTAGNVLFGSNFFWDNTKNNLGIGTNNVNTVWKLGVDGNVATTGALSFGPLTGSGSNAFIEVSASQMRIYAHTSRYLSFSANATEFARLLTTGNFILGTTFTDAGTRFQVYGDTLLNGTTNFSGAQLGVYGSTDKGQTVNTGSGGLFIGYYATGDLSYTTIPSVTIGRPNNRLLNSTSGTQIMGSVVGNYSPTSGTGQFITLEIVPTINQTGGANGITRGIYVNPTLTAAADWRSIEWSNNTGWGLYGAGTANSYFGGRVGIGTNTPLDFNLVVQGALQVRGSANSFLGLLIENNTIKRRDTGTFSLGSNDLATAIHIYASNNVGLSTSSDAGYKLDVNGTARVQGASNFLGEVTIGSNGAIAGNRIFFNYASTYGGDFTSQLAGVEQLSFGFNNLNIFGGGTSGVASGRTLYFYDRVLSASFGGYSVVNGWYFGQSSTRFGLRIENPNASVTAMTITAAGRLLLGTVSEGTFLLDVNGTARVSDTLTVGTSGNAIPATPKARFVNNTAGSDVEINGNGFARLYFNDYSRGTDLKYYEMLNYLGDWKISRLNDTNTTRTERLTIFGSTGNVFVGSSPSDSGFKLDVNGTARVSGATTISGLITASSGISVNGRMDITSDGANGVIAMTTLTNTLCLRKYVKVLGDDGGYGNNDASAAFQIDGTNRGFLPPRMTAAQIAAISTPAVGLVAYQTDGTEGLYQYKATGGWTLVSGSGGSTAYSVTSVSTTYSETATSGTKIIKATTAGGTFVITLPTAVGNTATLIIKKTAGSADLTIDGAGTETIDGGLTAILRRVDESITLVSDNANWLII
jgi:hypothetical protein